MRPDPLLCPGCREPLPAAARCGVCRSPWTWTPPHVLRRVPAAGINESAAPRSSDVEYVAFIAAVHDCRNTPTGGAGDA